MHVPSKPADNTAKIDFSTWGIWPPTLAKPMGEIIKDALDQFPPEFSLPFVYSPQDDGRRGKAVTDPMTIYCTLPFGGYLEENPEWAVSLRAIVEHELGMRAHEFKPQFLAIAAELRSLAEYIEVSLAE